MKYNLVKYYSEAYDALDEINKYLNREVLRKEILKDRLLSELQLGKWKPSDEMLSVTTDFIKKFFKFHEDGPLSKYPVFLDKYAAMAAYVDSGLTKKYSKEDIKKIQNFLKTRNRSLEKKDTANSDLPVLSKKDISNISMIFKTLGYMKRSKDPKIHKYTDTLNKIAKKYSFRNGETILGKLSLASIQHNLESGLKKDLIKDLGSKNASSYFMDPSFPGQSPYIVLNNDSSLTAGHEISHMFTNNEISADIGGAYNMLGLPSNISDTDALKTAQHRFNSLNRSSIGRYNKRLYKKTKFLNLLNTIMNTGTKYYTDPTDSAIAQALRNLTNKHDDLVHFINKNDIKNQEDYLPYINDLEQKINMLKNAKPLRTIAGEHIYSPEITDFLYNNKNDGYTFGKKFDKHPSTTTRANEVLHGLRPDLFTRDGIDKRTGKPVDFSLKGQIFRTLKRANTIGKRQFKVAVGKLKKSLGKIHSSTNKKSKSISSQRLSSPAIAGI